MRNSLFLLRVRAKALCHLAQCICSANDVITAAAKKLLTMPLTNGSMEEHTTPGLAAQEGKQCVKSWIPIHVGDSVISQVHVSFTSVTWV
jgi:hypothetical protein